jgi:hypothetical protein
MTTWQNDGSLISQVKFVKANDAMERDYGRDLVFHVSITTPHFFSPFPVSLDSLQFFLAYVGNGLTSVEAARKGGH